MGNLEKNLFEKIVTPFKKETYLKGLPLDRNIEEEKIESPIEKNKQPDNYEKLRENLKSRKKGGGDVHFSQQIAQKRIRDRCECFGGSKAVEGGHFFFVHGFHGVARIFFKICWSIIPKGWNDCNGKRVRNLIPKG